MLTQGAVAQLVARLVRNEKARGSNPLSSTTFVVSPIIRDHWQNPRLIGRNSAISPGWRMKMNGVGEVAGDALCVNKNGRAF